jgi:tetratricopeptide (TPR) repeat protein
MRVGALLAVSLLMGGAGAALAQPTEAQREAGEFFDRGEALRKDGKYREAIAAYQRANALAAHPNNLFNIALSYEKLGEWANAADYYERYLTADDSATDGEMVRAKIRDFRGRVAGGSVTPEKPEKPGPTPDTMGFGVQRTNPWETPAPPAPARWHFGASYGLGFGDAPVERFLGHGGIKLAGRLEFDAVLGKFGKNDYALGGMARLLVAKAEYMQPFIHGAATIGYAKQDDSSDASTKAPLGFEAGAGVRFGKQGRVEIAAVFRFVQGGFDETTTVVDSYINDAFAFAIDVGLAFDIPLKLPTTNR